MRKSILYGFAVLLLLSITSFFNFSLYLSIISIIGFGSVFISGLIVGAFVRERDLYSSTKSSNRERKDRKIGLRIAAFGLPFVITSIILFVFIHNG
ncbi:hypothetical protein SAMN05216389_106217 [Oceanobacillus limi]|uniref:DUF5316 domain-containing protein n=1 Tax=Oceanobacillus limi TaxID=930131 RepID=A0A1I0CHV0_9BACI|nr:DUF5316 family protein [Oceanobacillus limi]SET18545.1 hypothetical protein SAMN05216389_106217 [Oceanobacillus limi]